MDELVIAEILGTIAFALSGFYVAVKERLDLLGVFIASFLTALGGGIVRDTIASSTPYTFYTSFSNPFSDSCLNPKYRFEVTP
jgi:uncharacterized membrane protein YeiH